LSLPSYEAFRQALVDPALRAQIGLVISDPDAQSLAGNEEWARNYFDAWIAMAPAASAAPAASEAPTEAFAAAAPAQPFGSPAQPYAATQPYAAAPAQPEQGQPLQGQAPKKGLPGWVLAVIIGGAALVLLGGVGIAALVISTLNDVQENASASSQAEEPTEEPIPEETAPEDLTEPDDTTAEGEFPDFGLDYTEAEGQAYLAVAIPVYGLEASEYMDQDSIDEIVLAGGEAVCVSLATGASEAELIESLASVGMTDADAQTLLDAAKDNLCD
jgi:hypothetical protein